MKNTTKLIGIITLALIVFFVAACNSGGDDGGGGGGIEITTEPTKFEGRWLNIYGIQQGMTDYSYTFTGNTYVFNEAGPSNNYSFNGTFTFTDATISFTVAAGTYPEPGTYTQNYTLSGNVLNLVRIDNYPTYGPFTKQ